MNPWTVLGAAVIEGLVGYPERLHARAPHPVAWLGALIARLELAWNRPRWPPNARRALGAATVLLTASAAALAGLAVERALAGWAFAPVVIAVVGAFGLAGRSLHDHVRAVARPLATGDLVQARQAVGRIVGRDTAALDQAGVAAAALESLAESFCDGVVAPVFWFLVGGLPGLFAYKAVNTADSLIGHREPRWRDFGWAAARADDLMNLVPARIAGALVALAGGRGWRTMLRDAPKHASPNAGWPEAAMAGALGVRMGGPAAYDGIRHERPAFGEGPAPGPGDLDRGVNVYLRACGLTAAALAAGGFAWLR
ncbi:MAG TPA: adenosylcobinamide-phosphate synthase CbiB [Caulobacteraceae bacterium]|jgi:adenosylcobinamide-phosphate synthase|nr:adenosylcobinamide-phosphate synthase CbiB [Caulobacteraceae bacterium]